MASSDIVIGKVVVLQGHAYIRTADGAQIELKLGDPIHEGDVIVTGPGAVVQIGYGQGETYVVHQNETVTVDNSVFAVDGPDAHNAALTAKGAQLATITDAIASGNGSLDQLLEASAAGLGGGGGDTNDGHTFVQLVRIVEATTPAGLPTSTDDGSGQQTGQSSRTGISGPTAQDVAVSDTVSTAHEQPVHIRLTGTDASAPITSFTILDLPTNGTLYLADGKTPVHAGEVVSASGNGADLVFVAAAGTTAALASFHFSATDSQGAISNVATGTIDIIAAPAITINPIATIDGAEAGSAAPIAITGTVSSNVPVGDTVTLTVDGHSYTGTVQAGGTYSIGIPGNVLAGASVDSIHATVSVTNASGSVSTATADQGYNVELNAPAITISIDPIAPIDSAEAASSAPIAINGKVSSNVPVGDTVTLTVGGHSYTGTVQVGGTYSIGIPGNVLATAPVDSVHASVSATDAAGNTASASADQAYTLVSTPDSISISIDPIATINGAEAASGNPIGITGTVSSNVPVGDTVTLTVDGHSYTGTVQAGGTYSIGIPGNVLAAGPIDIVHATVSASDPAGNVLNASADQGYNVELVAPAISITIAPIAAITTAEAASSAPVAITGTVSSNVPIGDTVTLTIDGHTYTGTVHAGGTYSIGVPGNVLAAGPIDSVHASVSMTDAAGNSASASADQSYTVQGVSNPPTITIDPIATVNGAEGTSSAPVAITGTVSANVPVGDTVTLTVDGHSYTGFVLAGGVYSIGIPGNTLAGAATDDVHASVSITDAGGHVLTGTADQAYFVELNAPAISISIDPIAAITVSEAGSGAPVAITGSVSANVPVGDTVTLTVDGHTYTGTVQAGGTYSIGVPGNILAGASIDDVHASVAATDAAGNVANASADQSYAVLSSAPVISISIDPIATINGAEAGSSNPVTITGTVSSNVPVGDTVTLTIDGNVYTGTVQAGGTYSIGVPGNVLGSSTSDDVHVSVSVGSGAGTSTATADQNYNVELTAPAISIAIDPIADVTGSAGSSSTPIAITGTVSSNVPVGDTVTLTVDGHNYSGTVQAGGTYSIGVPGNVLAAAPIDSVHASVSMTDAAGNVASAGADQTYHVALDPNAITIEIDPIATINGAEAASANPIAITGTVSANVPVGDTVTLTIDGHDYTGTVQAGGTYSIDIPGTVLGAAASDNVHASVSATDSGGNVVNATADQGYTVELVAPAISIAVNAIPTITNAEAASANPVTINGTVSANVPVGDTVTLTVDGHDYTGTVQAGGTYSIGVPGNVLAGATTDSVHASVSMTDAAGNSSSASADQAYSVAPVVPPVTIAIDPIPTVNGAEAASSNPVTITGTVSSSVPVGDTVTLTIDGHIYTGTVQPGGTYSIGVPGNVLAGATFDNVHASVTATDGSGNPVTAGADQPYVVELTAPPIAIGIDPIATINGTEAASSNPVAVTGTVSANVPVGDTVTLTVDGHNYTGTVLAGGTYSIGVPGNVLAGAAVDSVHASVSMTDAAGNMASASADQAYSVVLSGPAITIGIDPIATVNGAEAASANPVAITGSVSANVPVGDTVTLTIDGNQYTGTVQSGGTYSIGVPGNVLAGATSDSVHASVSVTDAGGNVTSASADQVYSVELTAPPISIAIDPIATINGVEAASAAPVTVTGTVSANVPVGDTVTLTVDGHDYTGTVQAGGTYSIGVPGNVLAGAATDSIHASVSTTDAAGNTASASADQAYAVELTGPAISIAIDPIATVNGAEGASSNPIAITGTVSANVPVGDTVTLTVDGHDYTGTVQAGGTYSIGVPGNILAGAATDSIHASVSMTDAAGNTSNAGADQAYAVQLSGAAISIAIDPIATVNGAEAASSNPITITGTVSANVPVGDTVTLTVDGHDYTGTVQAGGTYTIGVPGNILAGAAADNIHASVSTTDGVGNTSTASADQAYTVELSAPPITIAIDPIATVNGAEAASSNPVAITGSVSANVPVGDTVTLTIDGHDYTGTVQPGGTYSIGVPGNILAGATTDNVHASVAMTDAAGNSTSAAADQAYTVELTAPAISISIDPVATINGAEGSSAAPVAITGTVSGNVPVGDTVTLTVDGHDYTGTVQAGGTYSIGVPGNVLAGAATDSIHASVSMTDAAGNSTNASADQIYNVQLSGPVISIAIDPIATVNGAEAASANPVAVTGTVSSNVPVGDTVTLTVDGHNYTGTVQAGGTYSIGVPGNILAGAPVDSVHAGVSTTDAFGNVSNASADQSYVVELTAPAISIAIDPFATVNGAEAASANPVTITGTVSSNVPVGDTVTLTVDGHDYTGTVQAGGTYSIGVPGNILAGAAIDSIHASVSMTDAAGNIANAAADQAYAVELTAPAISIAIDPIATVNGAEAASSNPIAITGTVSANVPVGDTVTLTIDGTEYTGTVQAGGTYSIGVPGNVLAGATTDTIHASVSATDAAGNTASAGADQSYSVDTVAPGAPVVAITTDANADGFINSSELNGASTVHAAVTLNAAGQTDLANGGSVQLTVTDAGVTQTLNLHMSGGNLVDGSGNTYGYSGGVISLTEAAPGDGKGISVTATETDAAGNVSALSNAAATEQLTAAAISIGIDSIAPINAAENASSNPIAITGTVSNNVPVGTTVTLTIDGHNYTGTVDAGDTYSINVPGNILGGAAADNVHASVSTTDAVGNVASASADQAYVVDTIAPGAPAVAIATDTNQDGVINSTELNGATTVHSTVILNAAGQTDLANGGTVQITVVDAGVTQSLNLHMSGGILVDGSGNQYGYSGGVITLTEAAPGDGNTITITSTETDAAGNASASSSAAATEDISAPGAPIVSISTDTNHDGFINTTELGASSTVQATVALNAAGQTDLANGGTVQLTVVDAGVTQTLNLHLSGGNLVDGSGNTYGYSGGVISLTEAAPGDGKGISVTATETDAAGNVSASSNAAATEQLTAAAISIGIDSIAPINAAENASSNPIAITGTVSSNVPVGTTVTLTIDGHSYTGTVGAGDTYSINVPGNVLGGAMADNVHASVSTTDAVGNVASASADQPYSVDTVAPGAPAVAIATDTNADGFINSSELNGATTVHSTVTLNAAGQTDLVNGGTVQITVVDNGVTQNLNLHLSGGNLVDGSGNTYAYSGGVITLTEAAPGDGNTIRVTSTETDAAGNVSASSNATATQDITAPGAPTVAITTDGNHDGVINSTELSGAANVQATVALNAAGQSDLANGGTVQITVVDAGATQNLTLHMSGGNLVDGSGNTYSYSGGVITLTETAPGDTKSISVTAIETDVAGNVSASSNAAATEHVTGPVAPVVTISSDTNHDGVLSGSEVTAEATAGVAVGTVALNAANLSASGSATVTVVDNGVTTTLNVASNGIVTGAANGVSGTYSGGVVTVNFINPGDAHSATITATQTDQYGNTANSNTASVTEHIAAPPAPVVTITSDSNHDGVLNSGEISAEATAGVTVGIVALNAANLSASGSATVTIVDNGVTTTLNVASNGTVTGAANGVSGTYSAGVVTVNFSNPGDTHSATIAATQTDQYGNTANGNTASVTEHIAAPPAPVVTITSDSNDDGVLNSSEVTAEATAGVAIGTVALNAANLSASGSATVTVVDNGVTTTLNIASNGTVTGAANGVSGTYSGGVVTVNFINPGDAHSATITATQTDQYGNTANGNTASVTEHIAALPAPVVTITSDSNHDGVLNSSEVTAEATAGVAIGTVALNAANLSASGSATVTVVDNGVTTTLNVASNGTVTGAANGVSGTYSGGVVTVNFINPGDAHSATITATQTDQYGNTANSNTASVTEHIAAPPAPVVTITSDSNHDGVLNSGEISAEATAGVAVGTVALNAANLIASGSATITVVDNGVTTTLNVASNGTVTGAANGVSGTYSGGVVTVNFVNPGDAHSATITATQTDQYGNTANSNTASVTEHISAPSAPVVTITSDSNHDGVLNSGEISAEATAGVAVGTVALNAVNLSASGSATVTVVDNGVTTTLNVASNGTVTGAANGVSGTYSAGVVTVNFANPGDAHSATITATQTDQYGNTANGNTASVTEHIAAPPAPVVTISSDTNHDGVLNSGEISAEATAGVAVGTVALNAANLSASGSATVTVVDNGVTTTLNVASNGTVTGAANGVSGTYSAGVVTANFANPGDTHSATITATQTDQYGNTTNSNTASVTEHIAAPPAPVVTITSDSNHDGVLNSGEISAEATAGVAVGTVALNAANLSASGSATVTVVDNGVSTTLSVASNGTVTGAANGVSATYSAGVVTVHFANPGDTHSATITATQTDQYGNVANSNTASVTEDITAPGAPTVAITTDANHDGYINSTELNGATTVHSTVTLNAAGQTDLSNGGTVQITVVDNGVTQNLNLHLNGGNLVDGSGNTYAYSGGVITLTETAPGDGKTITVTSTETDSAGNVSTSSSATATEDITAPGAPTVSITTDANHDGVINATELNGAANVQATVTLNAAGQTDLANGGTVQLTVVDAGVTQALNLHLSGGNLVDGSGNTYAYSGGVITLTETAPGDTKSISVTATETDVAGNVSASSNAAATELVTGPVAPVVTITSDSNHDGVLNSSEVTAEATAGVAIGTVALNAANLSASGSATVTVVDNGVTTTLNVASNGTVTGAANGVSGTYSAGVVTVNFANPGDAHSATITATQTDQYGNTANGNTASVTEHIAAPPATVVTITSDTNHDGVLNSGEISAEATAGVAVGTVALNAANLSASGSATVTVVDNGVTTTLNIASNGTVTGAANGVSGTYSGGVVTVNFINPGDAHSATITATQTDQYGNMANGNTASVTEHIAAPPAPVVTITSDSNHDGVLNSSEVTAEATAGVAVGTVALNAANLSASGSATVTVVDNGVTTTLTVASNGTVTGAANGVSGTYSAGVVTVNFANPGDTHSATITATQTDQYGNTTNSNTASVTEHISAPPAPVVTITSDSNHDGVLSGGEVSAEATAGVAVGTVALNAANLAASGSATVTVVDNGITTTLTVASNGTVNGAANGVSGTYSAGVVTVNFANPGDTHSATITATQTDQFGNTANSNTASVTEHISAPPAPVVTITSDSNHDGVLNSGEVSAEATAGVAVGTVALNAANLAASGSATVTVVDNGVTTTLNVASNGTVTGAANGVSGTYSAGVVTVNFANPGDTHSATITATQTDQYGNTAISNTASVTEHISAPPAPVVTITSDTNHDGVLSGGEVSAEATAGVAVGTVALNAANLAASGSATVTVVDNGVTTTLTVASNGTVTGAANGVSGTYSAGVVTVNFANPGDTHNATITATQTDQYGNTANSNTASVTEHISAPPAPVVTITSDSNHDGVLSGGEVSAEATAGVAVGTVALNAANLAASGSATVTVVDNGVTTTLTVASNGTVTGAANGVSGTYSAGIVTVNFANPGDTHSATITATQTDQYGNTANSNTASVTEHISAPPAPVVTITSDSNHDGLLNSSEVSAEATAGVAVATVALNAANLSASGSATVTVVDNGVSTTLSVASNGTVTGAANGVSATYSAGVVTVHFANPGDTHSATITATQTDQYGNVANSNTASVTEDITAPGAPTVAITTDANHDGYINSTELNGATTVHSTVTLNAAGQTDLSNGGTVQITVVDNGVTQNLNLHLNGGNLVDGSGNTYAYSGGVITLTETAPGDGKTITVTSTETDSAGNVSTSSSATATEDITAPGAPTVSITTDANHDGVINATELNGAANVQATVTLNAAGQTDLANGGTVQLTVVDAGVTQALNLHLSGGNLVDGSGNTYSYSGGVITLTETAPGDGNSISVTSTVTDVAGNASTSSTATAKEDISAPAAPTVAITTDANSNGFITNAELSGSSTVHATVALNAAGQTDLTNGGTVQITVVDAGVTQNLVLHMSGSNLIDGSGNTYAYSGGVITLTETSPGDTKTITVTSTETDAAGNVSAAGSATATEDLVVPVAPTASITTDSNQDGYISVAELNGSSTVNATVTLATAAQTDITNGGSVQVTVNDGGVVQNLSLHLSGANLVDGSGNTYGYTGGVITLTETAPASGSSISVSATVIDKAGNVSVASNTATAQVDIVDAPAVAIAFPPSISTGLTQSQWINNATINGALYTTAGNNGNGTNPGTLINTLNNTAISPTTSVVTAVSNASVTAGTATETSGLIYLQAGHTYAFSGAIDDSFGLQVGGKLVGTDTWGINSGAFSGSFTASANGWYTIATYHDNQSGPGNYNLNVSDNGATAVALNATNFTLAPSLAALASAGIALNAEVVTTTTTNITTTGSNSSGAATVGTTVTGGYYTTEPVASITLDSNDQAILTAGGTMHVTGSDGTNMTLHWNGSALVDGSGTSHTYSGGIVSLPLAANLNTPVVTVSATVTDTHGISSLTTTTSEIYSGTNSLTEVAGGDTFRFELAANGTAGTPHIETISGFNSNVSSNGGDVLNLADLLQGATSSNITNYLHFTTATSAGVTTTTVHVSETGGYSAGFSSTLDTLQIALTNVDLVHSGGSTLTDAAIIQSLLTKGKLVE